MTPNTNIARGWRRGREGMALLTATMFMAVAMVILGALAIRVINQSNQTSHYERYRAVFHGLEAALAHGVVQIEAGNPGHVGAEAWEPPLGVDDALPAFGDAGIEPLTLPGQPNVEFFAYVVDWGSDGVDNNGDGTVDGPEEQGWYTIHCYARWGSVQRRAEAVMRSDDVNVWRNAIFAGSGQAGGLINGNVSIHGSVHLLGENVAEGGTSIAALDLSGTSLVHNNYGELSSNLRQRVPPLPQRMYEGEMVETLHANLRVKSGLVSLSGNSEIGSPHVPGSGEKGPMDGTFVNDGWTGNSTIDDGGRGVPTRVTSDNGWNQRYDLGERVPFPLLDHDYRDSVYGHTLENPDTLANYSHDEFFSEVLAGEPYDGDITIHARNTDEFYYNATNPDSTDPGERQSTDNYIYYNGDEKVLYVNGPVIVDGNLSLTGQGSDRTIHYNGRAAWLVRGDVDLDANLYTVNSDGSVTQSFPHNNILGIMAEGSMMVGGSAQLTLMGAFYAENQIATQRQSTILGTFVSNYFDMGTNVPSIFQIPTLADNLPEGMIGAYPIRVLSRVSWREIGG